MLDINFDHKLKFTDHIDEIYKKGWLARIASYMGIRKRRNIMNAFFKSQFNYCPLMWMCCNRSLNLVSSIFYQIFVFLPNGSPLKTEKCFLFHPKSSFRSWDIQIFVIFYLPFHTFQIQKDKWKWNNLWCHDLTCINLQMSFLE